MAQQRVLVTGCGGELGSLATAMLEHCYANDLEPGFAFEMELDHDIGDMRGRFIAGRHRGAELDTLDEKALAATLGDVDDGDAQDSAVGEVGPLEALSVRSAHRRAVSVAE